VHISVVDGDRESVVPSQPLSGTYVLDIETHLCLAVNMLQYQDPVGA
jgi:hypothetical protein